MKKVYVKYFIDFLASQENWLNIMSHNGWRLTKTSRLLYEFESCNPEEYEYHVEFVAHMSNSERKKYIDFIKDYGYNVFVKNINLNYSIGKIRWRPWAKGMGQISTSPGNYNKELLIIERKKESKPFELHTSLDDVINYIKPIRNAHIFIATLLIGLILISYPWNMANILDVITIIILGGLTLIFSLNSVKYSRMLIKYKKDSKIYE